MAHELRLLLNAWGRRPWLIDGDKAEEILAFVERRMAGPTEAFGPGEERAAERRGSVAVLPLVGTIVPRGDSLNAMSGSVSIGAWLRRFEMLASDPDISAIVIEVDSPGGQVDLVPEAAAAIRAARRENRPIVAHANTVAASAAYWIASAADEIVATPSGEVGSIGVFTVHEEMSQQLEAEGVRMTIVRAGPRKAEINPFEPLSDEARAFLAARVSATYEQFTAEVAKARGVAASVVRADPVKADRHFGGGRSVGAREALAMGMIDRIETLGDTVARLSRRRTTAARRRMAVA